MKHQEGSFKASRSTGIFYQSWLPDTEPKTALVIVHGLAEHSGRYMNLVNHFVPLGYAVYGLDHIGHGRSEGTRVHVQRFEDFTDTLKTFLDMVRGWHPAKPLFVVGHSMGGLIALDAEGVSRDPAVVEAYVNDPLVYRGKTTARLAAEMLKAMQRVSAEAGRITLPILILQGGADRLVDPSGARMLYEKVGAKDKTVKVYDGLYHEVFNEPEHDQVLSYMEGWLTSHANSQDSQT